MYGIFVNGNLDTEPEKMIFDDHATAMAAMQELKLQGVYTDDDNVTVELLDDEPVNDDHTFKFSNGTIVFNTYDGIRVFNNGLYLDCTYIQADSIRENPYFYVLLNLYLIVAGKHIKIGFIRVDTKEEYDSFLKR